MTKPILTLLMCVFLLGTNGLILAPLLTDVASDLETTIPIVARAIAAFGAGTAIFSFTFGRSLDHFGLRRALCTALVFGAVSQGVTSISAHWSLLIGAQFATGAAMGIGLPAIYAITKLISEPGRESKRMSQVLTGWSLGLILAVPIGAWIAFTYNWQAVFAILAVAHIVMLVFAFNLPAIPEPEHRKKSTRLTPVLRAGGPSAYGICFLFMASFYGGYTLTGDYTVNGLHQTTAAAGLVALVYGVGFGLGAFAAHRLDRWDTARTQVYMMTMGAGVLFAMGLAPNFNWFLIAIFGWGFINHLNLNLILRRISELVPDAPGAALGLYSAVTYAAACVGAYVFSLIYSNFGFMQLAITASAFHLVGSMLAYYSAARDARLRSCGSR